MFQRKLTALDFYAPTNFTFEDEASFRSFISWIENQKIRLYKIEDRAGLDNIENEAWPSEFQKYLETLDIDGAVITANREVIIERLLSHALSLEYADFGEKYNAIANENNHKTAENFLESIDYNSDEFKQGIRQLQTLLDIPTKENDTTSVLQAISKLIVDKLNTSAIQETFNQMNAPITKKKESEPVQLSLDTFDLGIQVKDDALRQAAKILRLIHVKELRQLQTKINETIVAIQMMTANPKTDPSLGKIGI